MVPAFRTTKDTRPAGTDTRPGSSFHSESVRETIGPADEAVPALEVIAVSPASRTADASAAPPRDRVMRTTTPRVPRDATVGA